MKWKSAAIIVLTCTTYSWATFQDWDLYEETSLPGVVSGAIKKGSVLKTQSGSVYQVSGITIQVVVEVMPKVIVLRNDNQFKLIVDGFDEPLICNQLTPPSTPIQPQESAIPQSVAPAASESAPDDDVSLDELIPKSQQSNFGLQKLNDAERERLRKFLVRLYTRGVDDGKRRSQVRQPASDNKAATPNVIESQVEGEFEGWDGETIVKLTNGQIWQQTAYHYHYHYAYRPEVLVYQSDGVYKMKVEGVDHAVTVTRLK